MVISTIGMMAQLCFVEQECFASLDEFYFTSEAKALNSSTNSTVNKALVEHDFLGEDLTFGVFCVLAMLAGVVLNVLTMVVLKTGTRNSKEVRTQLMNLAVADCLFAVVGPLTFFHIRFEIPITSNLIGCKIIGFLGFLAVTISPLCNVAISIDRVVAVYFPMKIRNYRYCHKVITAVCVWVISIIVDMGPLFNATTIELNGQVWCFASPVRYYKPFTYAEFYVASGAKYGVPALIIIVMYSLIAFKLLRRKTVGERTASVKKQEKSRREKLMRSTIVVLCTDAFFTLLTWLPFTIFQLISTDFILNGTAEIFEEKTSKIINMFKIQGFLTCLLMTNCFSSPVIYFWFNRSFREDVQALFACCGCGKRRALKRALRASAVSRSTNISVVSHSSSKDGQQNKTKSTQPSIKTDFEKK